MQCRYCGAEMPLLKKIATQAEFCSDAHRRKYLREFDRLAVLRLMEAQTTPAELAGFVDVPLPPQAQRRLLGYTERPVWRIESSPVPPGCPLTPGVTHAPAGAAPALETAPERPPLSARYAPYDPGPPRKGPALPVEKLYGMMPFSWRLEQARLDGLEWETTGLDLLVEAAAAAADEPDVNAAEAEPEEPQTAEGHLELAGLAPAQPRPGTLGPVVNCPSILPGALRVLLPAPSLQPIAPRVAAGPKPVDETPAAESVPEEPAPPDAKPVPVAPVAIPAFAAAVENLAGAGETGERPRWWKYFAVLAACGAIGAYLLLSPAGQESAGRASRAAGQADQAVGGFGWTTEWAGDTDGSARGRQLKLYDASAGKRDYRMEFSGRIHVKSLGWVFRHTDSRNYYLMKLEVLRPGRFPVVKLIRYAVVNGEESEHRQITLPFGVQVDTVYKVALDVKGQRFTASIQDQVVDLWIDGALKSGAAGFFHDRGEEGTIQAVRITMGGG